MADGKVFLDANILVYAHDISAGTKHEAAREMMTGLWKRGGGALSTQVLQEFYVNVTQKLPKPIDVSKAQRVL